MCWRMAVLNVCSFTPGSMLCMQASRNFAPLPEGPLRYSRSSPLLESVTRVFVMSSNSAQSLPTAQLKSSFRSGPFVDFRRVMQERMAERKTSQSGSCVKRRRTAGSPDGASSRDLHNSSKSSLIALAFSAFSGSVRAKRLEADKAVL